MEQQQQNGTNIVQVASGPQNWEQRTEVLEDPVLLDLRDSDH